jgi:aerobic carbon-monoxide dehydrogenase medium subunit
VKPAPFAYLRPSTLEEAVGMLADGDAKVLAGGQSLVPIMSMRLASPARLVDINHLAGLDAIEVDEKQVRIGCLTRHRSLELDDEVPRYNWFLRQALAHVAHPAIRNRGTTVGSLVHADPAAEMPAVLSLLGGSVEAMSAQRGRRTIEAADFFVGPMESALAADELAVAATFPNPPPNSGTSWIELSRRHGDYALVGVGALVTLDADGAVVGGSLSLIGVGATPAVVDVTDLLADVDAGDLVGRSDETIFEALADRVSEAVDPEPDIHASADYRLHLARVLSQRAVAGAARNAVDLPTGGDPPAEDPDEEQGRRGEGDDE